MSEYLVITYNATWQVRAPVVVMWAVVAWLKVVAWVRRLPSNTVILRIR